MQTVTISDAMAAWRATGGAQPATIRIDDQEGDDGLTAIRTTSPFGGCWVDTSLTAGTPTVLFYARCS